MDVVMLDENVCVVRRMLGEWRRISGIVLVSVCLRFAEVSVSFWIDLLGMQMEYFVIGNCYLM